jgi:DNA repair photolyase
MIGITQTSASLLPDEPHPEALPASGGVEYLEMPVRQILNRCDNPRMPFRWTINPYRGCEFGCVYCYARYTHEFLEQHDPMDFERRIFVKRMAAEVLARTLSRTPIGTDPIAIGTATDPYQPAERKYGLTRSMLEVFAQLGGLSLSITTKSNLIVRDLDLLRSINARSRLSVNFSLITMNRRLQRVLEPRASRPELRLRALSELSDAGIRCNILVMPVIPGLTDQPGAIESVIRAARAHGAAEVWWRSLFLKPAAARRFVPFVRETFPHLAGRIDEFYARSTYAPHGYDERLGAIFDRIKRKYGYAASNERDAAVRPRPAPAIQLSLGVMNSGNAFSHRKPDASQPTIAAGAAPATRAAPSPM